jgi:hypothetical protein
VAVVQFIELVATVAGGVNTVRDSFQFDPDVFYRVSVFSGIIGVGLDAKFP